jgi:uncharacterized YccA/Bax inhibitor family protein
MTIRNLALSCLLALATCAGPNFAIAQDAPACDVNAQEVTLESAVTKQGLKITKLDVGQTQAFNAELAKENGTDVKDFPAIDHLDVVMVATDNGEKVALLFAFKDGCYIGAIQMPEDRFNSIVSRTQASQ